MTTKTKLTPKMGRPPEPVPQGVADEIIEWISQGKTLSDYCRKEGAPCRALVYVWMGKDKDFYGRFARAREVGTDAIAEETLEIVDAPPERIMNESGTGSRVDPGYVAYTKARVEQRMKLLAKWNPKGYGDRLDVDLSVSVALDTAILAARKRVNQPE